MRVAKSKDHQVLDRLFAQIVVDSVDLLLGERRADDVDELASRLQIVAKRLLDDHAGPASGSS